MTCPCGNTIPKSRERYCSDKCAKRGAFKRERRKYRKFKLSRPWYLTDIVTGDRSLGIGCVMARKAQ